MPVFKKENGPVVKVSKGFERRIVNLDNLMAVECSFLDGPMKEREPFHSHPNEQISYLAEGQIIVFLGEEKHHLKKGDFYTVKPDLPHGIQTLTERVVIIDSFYPLRKDFLR
jgi:quercetin dioxygenase-like cupin family protein